MADSLIVASNELKSNDIAGSGGNEQASALATVNFDLPWSLSWVIDAPAASPLPQDSYIFLGTTGASWYIFAGLFDWAAGSPITVSVAYSLPGGAASFPTSVAIARPGSFLVKLLFDGADLSIYFGGVLVHTLAGVPTMAALAKTLILFTATANPAAFQVLTDSVEFKQPP